MVHVCSHSRPYVLYTFLLTREKVFKRPKSNCTGRGARNVSVVSFSRIEADRAGGEGRSAVLRCTFSGSHVGRKAVPETGIVFGGGLLCAPRIGHQMLSHVSRSSHKGVRKSNHLCPPAHRDSIAPTPLSRRRDGKWWYQAKRYATIDRQTVCVRVKKVERLALFGWVARWCVRAAPRLMVVLLKVSLAFLACAV